MKNFKDLIKVADVYGTETRQAHELSEATLDENWFTDSVNAIKNALGISDDEAKTVVSDYVHMANILLDQRLATVEVLTSLELKTKVSDDIENKIDIPFRENVIKRQEIK